ncbi:MAG TPA: hypothetical protein VHP62_01750 [Usitatibacter sp.]|jgi:hypothetical protein|nr:hypothetical protein [Usitatibacter sp.]
MTDDGRNFWRALFSVPNIVATAFFLIGVGGWWADQQAFRSRVDERLMHIENRLDTIDGANAAIYVRRDVMTEQLSKIQQDVGALRDEVHDVKNEVRKIR